MHTDDRIWMTPRARENLEAELACLLAVPTRAEADRSDQIVDAWLARKERIRQIHELLSKADTAVSPPDDGIAEPGMVLTVRYEDSGDAETFLLGTRGISDTELEVYTVNSPLGSALLGAKAGERRSYALPNGGIQHVTVLSAKPFGAHLLADAESRELAKR
ncbi:transcription elongation factor [Mycolicibacterium chubuense NBB4]|uniref:Transcription elongation factor n=1 Tax=Mycolicibacterium chubuense (strain NBB4) TaxID=710421 RepID=I4BNP0_MYCCN|nr:GreA/GreB family elongation factor [Mycolicibacterium chubuense]AFM18897.1 transcription elongation factor [Mycolicibacterium chubuense NBB4]